MSFLINIFNLLNTTPFCYINAYEFFILQLGCKIFQEVCKGMFGARKMPQSHIHKPPKERNKGSIKYIQSCGEIRSFCCVWWRKGEMAGKRKDQPTLSVSIIWEMLAFTFTERSKQLDWLLKEWSRSSKVAIVVKCFPSSHQMLPLNTQILLHLSTQIILHLRTQILFHLSRQILFYLSTQIILHLLLSKK